MSTEHSSQLQVVKKIAGCNVEAEKRRTSNRKFMQQWRTDSRNQARERERRRDRYYSREKQNAIRDIVRSVSEGLHSQTCHFCSRPAVANITRLEISDDGPEEYVEVQIPYCGKC